MVITVQRIHIPLYCETEATEDHGGLERYRSRHERNLKRVRRAFHSSGHGSTRHPRQLEVFYIRKQSP